MLKGEGGECKNREGEVVLLQWDVKRGCCGVNRGGRAGLCGSGPQQGCVPLPWRLASPESSFPALSQFLCARGVLLLFLPSAGAGRRLGDAGGGSGASAAGLRRAGVSSRSGKLPVRPGMGRSPSVCPAARPRAAPAGGDVEIPGSGPFLQLVNTGFYRDGKPCSLELWNSCFALLHSPSDVGYSPSVEKYNASEMQPRLLLSAGGSFPQKHGIVAVGKALSGHRVNPFPQPCQGHTKTRP